MKLHSVVTLLVLVLFTTVPDDTEAASVAWFLRIAAKLGVKLVKNSYYARCNTRRTPPGISCPSVVYGVGLSRGQAQNSARVYAATFGDDECKGYVGHCSIKKFIK